MRISVAILFFMVLWTCSLRVSGQGNVEKKVKSDTVPTLEFESKVEEEPKKKKKVKKKVYYGLKCKRGFTRKGVGDREVVESFYFLKSYKEPNPYVKKIYVYDMRKQQIAEVTEIDKKDVQFYKILHGPYKKIQGGSVIEEGIFYIGTKHGRWERYAPSRKEVFLNSESKGQSEDEDEKVKKTEIEYSILLDKEKYYRGWPKEAKITFYDGAHSKIKEVLPYEFEKLHGDYYYFKENGDILIQGKYIDGKKAGLWVEFYPNKKQKYRETQYPVSPYHEDQFEPYVLTEWDEKGNLTISKGKAVEPGEKVDHLKDHFKRNKKRK